MCNSSTPSLARIPVPGKHCEDTSPPKLPPKLSFVDLAGGHADLAEGQSARAPARPRVRAGVCVCDFFWGVCVCVCVCVFFVFCVCACV